MKNNQWNGVAIIVAIAVFFLGVGYFAWFGSEGEHPPSESRTLDAAHQEQTMPQGKEMTLSGTVNKSSKLVDDSGDTFELANTDAGLEVQSLIGRKVEVTGTVMEESGQQIVEVHDYKVLGD